MMRRHKIGKFIVRIVVDRLRGRKLARPKDLKTRPTTDLVHEAL
jgi:16S rRNA G966 N2-methylase RsmD